MGKRSITMAFSDDVFDVFDEMKKRRTVRSGLVEDLILAYRDNGYKIPVVDTEYIDNRKDESYTPPEEGGAVWED